MLNKPTIRISLFLIVVITALVAHAGFYSSEVVSQQIRHDGFWHIHETLVPIDEGTFDFRDLFTMRSSNDQAFPVYRLTLIANAKWFSLDFRVESVIGFLFSLLLAAFFWRYAFTKLNTPKTWAGAIAVFCIMLVVFSFNSVTRFNWPLVAYLAFPLFCNVVLMAIYEQSWVNKDTNKAAWLGIAAIATLFISDAMGMVTILALLMVSGILLFLDRERKARVWLMACLLYTSPSPRDA